MIIKSEELKNALLNMYNKKIWNKETEIDGERYIYISVQNYFKKIIDQPSGKTTVLIGCINSIGQFVWCC